MVLFYSVNAFMLDPLRFQFILVKMLDFVSTVCYSMESFAMPSSCYITFVLVEIYLMPSSFHFTVSPIFNKPELLSIFLYMGCQAESDLYDTICSAFHSSILVW